MPARPIGPEEMARIIVDGASYSTRLTRKYRERKPVVLRDPGRLLAHLPGTIVEVLVEPGQPVERGAGLVVLEAMKMRNSLTAPASGTVARLHVRPGQLVARGDLLAEIAPAG